MNITEVRIFPVNEEKLKAYVTVTFEDSFVIRDLKIIKGNNRYFVAMPSRRLKDGSYRDIVHPSNVEMREQLENKIFEEYEQETGTSLNADIDFASTEETTVEAKTAEAIIEETTDVTPEVTEIATEVKTEIE